MSCGCTKAAAVVTDGLVLTSVESCLTDLNTMVQCDADKHAHTPFLFQCYQMPQNMKRQNFSSFLHQSYRLKDYDSRLGRGSLMMPV